MTLAATGRWGTTSTWRKKQALSFSRGDGQRLFLTLLKVWEWVPWKRSESFWSTFIIMMVSYHMRNSFSCTMKSTEPICDLLIAKFSHASQFLRLIIEPTQLCKTRLIFPRINGPNVQFSKDSSVRLAAEYLKCSQFWPNILKNMSVISESRDVDFAFPDFNLAWFEWERSWCRNWIVTFPWKRIWSVFENFNADHTWRREWTGRNSRGFPPKH